LHKTAFHLVALGSCSQVVVRVWVVALSAPSPAPARTRDAPDAGAVCATVRESRTRTTTWMRRHCRSGGPENIWLCATALCDRRTSILPFHWHYALIRITMRTT